MKHYYTSITITNEGYVGKVFDPNNNQVVYATKVHSQQIGAASDVANYLKTTNAPSADSKQVFTSTPTSAVKRKCCGRQ